MMEVHLLHDIKLGTYCVTLINTEVGKGWYVWESASKSYPEDWDKFEYYFQRLEDNMEGWCVTDEDAGRCIYRGTDAREAKQAAMRYTEYL